MTGFEKHFSEIHPAVGVGVLLSNSKGQILLGKRKGSHGAGKWAVPGGWLDYGETLKDCCRRECLEEVNLEIKDIDYQYFEEYFSTMPRHVIHYAFFAKAEGEPTLMEPDKCEKWEWFSLDNLPPAADIWNLTQDMINSFEYFQKLDLAFGLIDIGEYDKAYKIADELTLEKHNIKYNYVRNNPANVLQAAVMAATLSTDKENAS
jgi:8-oxo-dGTP diphosphatase